MARNRIIYASQSVFCNGEILYRVQSFGSTTTFTSADVYELGHLDLVDIVDDVPAVAITMNTNDFGDVRTLAVLAQLPASKIGMNANATVNNANLVVVSGTNLTKTNTFLHGVALADFAITCGNLPGVTFWAPVQDECSLGTLDGNIDQTLFMDKVYINNLEFGYTMGANATENYGAETDNKTWLLNSGRFVNWEVISGATMISGSNSATLTLASGNAVATLSNGIGFLRRDVNGAPALTYYIAATNTMEKITIVSGTTAAATTFVYHNTGTGHVIYGPTNITMAAADEIYVLYAADAYGTAASDLYFDAMTDASRPTALGGLRHGQVEIYIVEENASEFDVAWRLTGCNVTASLARTPLSELGHLNPYDRPLTLPVPLKITVESTAGDLQNWSTVAAKLAEFEASSLDELNLADLMSSEKLKLVVKVYGQTDEEAGGTGANRIIADGSKMIGQAYLNDGVYNASYAKGDREYALKTLIVEHLKITDESAALNMGNNMTQTFGFRSTNDLYLIKGDISIGNITNAFKVRRNA